MFKWVCLSVASVFGIVTLYVIIDLKRDVTQSIETARQTVGQANEALLTINAELPTIVGEVKKSSRTLSELSEDVKLLKSVAGIDSQDRGVRGLAAYADDIQKVLLETTREQEASILIEEIFGKDLKRVESVDEFLVGLNKEMLLILAVAKSKEEVLWRSCQSGLPRRKPYHIQIGEAPADSAFGLDQTASHRIKRIARIPTVTGRRYVPDPSDPRH